MKLEEEKNIISNFSHNYNGQKNQQYYCYNTQQIIQNQ